MVIKQKRTIPEGYKVTDLGEIPVEWEAVELGNVLTEVVEKTKINDEYEVLSSTTTGLFKQNDYFNRKIASSNNIGYKVLRKSQIVFSPQNLWMGNINFNDKYEIGIVSPSYKIFNIVNGIEKLFISFLIKTPKMLNRYRESSEQGASIVRRNLDINLFYSIKIPIPTLKEQQKIAEILKSVDEQIEISGRLINNIKELKKGLMQQLLTKGVGHTDFKQTEIGRIPIKWGCASLNEICEKITDGTHHSPITYSTGTYKYITAKNIKENGVDLSDISFVSEKDHKEIYKRCDVKKNDVLYIKDGATTGVATINDLCEEFSLLSSVALLRIKKDIYVPKFLMYCLNSPRIKQQMLGMMSGNAIRRLTLKKIQSGVVPIPPVEEQLKIIDILSSVDEQINTYEQEKAKYEELKKGLMQQLLTGKLRVTV